MDCLHCKYPDTRVYKTIKDDCLTTRRRECMRCGARFITHEKLRDDYLKKANAK